MSLLQATACILTRTLRLFQDAGHLCSRHQTSAMTACCHASAASSYEVRADCACWQYISKKCRSCVLESKAIQVSNVMHSGHRDPQVSDVHTSWSTARLPLRICGSRESCQVQPMQIQSTEQDLGNQGACHIRCSGTIIATFSCSCRCGKLSKEV